MPWIFILILAGGVWHFNTESKIVSSLSPVRDWNFSLGDRNFQADDQLATDLSTMCPKHFILHISNEMKEWLLLTYLLNTRPQGNESKKWRQPLFFFFFSWYYASIHEVFTYCQNTVGANSETCASSVVKRELQKFVSLFLRSGCEERVKEFVQSISGVSESEAVGRAKLRKDSLGTHWYHYACRMNLVFCPVFKHRHLSFQKKSLKGFSAILWCLFDRAQVGNASVLETLLRNEFDNFVFWS